MPNLNTALADCLTRHSRVLKSDWSIVTLCSQRLWWWMTNDWGTISLASTIPTRKTHHMTIHVHIKQKFFWFNHVIRTQDLNQRTKHSKMFTVQLRKCWLHKDINQTYTCMKLNLWGSLKPSDSHPWFTALCFITSWRNHGTQCALG